MKTIAITTDFNDQFATSQLHAVLDSMNFRGRLIENHNVSPYSIVEGSYAIWQLIKVSKKNTVHLGVIDPGVGSERDGIIVKTRNFWFVGPNNGLFWESIKKDGFIKAWKVNEKYFGTIARTFHGRDVFIKSAVLISKDISPEKFRCQEIKLQRLVKLEFKDSQVVHIDHYGNLKVWGDNTLGLPVVDTFSNLAIGKAGILKGSSDLLEIFVNQSSAKDYFKVKLGQVIKKL